MSDFFIQLIYVPVEEMPSLKRRFYTELYHYKKMSVEYKSESFKTKPQVQKTIKELNELAIMLFKIENPIYNKYGEVAYPSCAYKVLGGKLFVCLANTPLYDKIDIKYIFGYLSLYMDGTINVDNKKNILVSSTIRNIEENLKCNYSIFEHHDIILLAKNISKKLSGYPQNSICVLNLGTLFTVEETKEVLFDFQLK